MAAPIERKVQAFTSAGIVSGLIIWAITTWIPGFEAGVPEPIVNFLNWIVPVAIGFIAAFAAKHTARPSIDPRHVIVRPKDAQPSPGHGAGDDRSL